MTRQTPMPLLRNLAPNLLIVRCSLCFELTACHELCQSMEEAEKCPSRALVDAGLPEMPIPPLSLPLLTLRNLDA